MIVKNEAAVIRRCLDSVRPIIDHWIIVDTGSTDGTQQIIREHLRDLPGELHERPWQDFAHNRSEALELARGKCDYTLIIDADDTLEIAHKNDLEAMTADSYMLTINDSGFVYQRPQLMRSALPWRYEGVLHEYLTCELAEPGQEVSGIAIRLNQDGARRKDPTTYRRDAEVLETALRTETNPFLLARYRFYLGQSYRDCGNLRRSLDNYLARAELGYWQEEVFVSLYCAAQLKEQLGYPDQAVIDTYLAAADSAPTRAEALHHASRFCRQKARYDEGYRLAKRALDIPMPLDALFVEPWIYEIGVLDEYALNAYWSGRNRDCLDASLKLLANAKLPPAEIARVVRNAQFASRHMGPDPDHGSLGAETFAAQHALASPRPLRSRLVGAPHVRIAIRTDGREDGLPLYLQCLEALDYPKSAIVLSVQTGGTEGSDRFVRAWVGRIGHLYAAVEFDVSGPGRAPEQACDFHFETDPDSFVRPCTLRELVALDLPIVAPFLRSIEAEDRYSNFHAEIDARGYFKECDQYSWIMNRLVRGIVEIPVVKAPYLVRADGLDRLSAAEDPDRHDYVVFAESARLNGIQQYLDNRQVYGYVLPIGDSVLSASEQLGWAEELLGSEPSIPDAAVDVSPPGPAYRIHAAWGRRAPNLADQPRRRVAASRDLVL